MPPDLLLPVPSQPETARSPDTPYFLRRKLLLPEKDVSCSLECVGADRYQRRGHITWDVMLLWVLPFSCQAPARTCQGVIGSALSTHDECMYNLSDRCCWERKRGRKNEPGERDRYKTLHIKEKSHLWNTVSRGRRLSEPQTMSSSSSTIDS